MLDLYELAGRREGREGEAVARMRWGEQASCCRQPDKVG
jgi:hypothetical protein